jgi:hypothetical protein
MCANISQMDHHPLKRLVQIFHRGGSVTVSIIHEMMINRLHAGAQGRSFRMGDDEPIWHQI